MFKNALYYIVLILAFLFAGADRLHAGGRNFTLVIDAGHGGKDPGANGSIAKEKNINLNIALKVGKIISRSHNDVNVIYTRTTDKFIDLSERADIANRNKADLFISIHTNAVAKNKNSAKGTETYVMGLARTDENLAVAKRENSAILLEDNYQVRYEGFDPNSTESYIIFEFMQNKFLEQSVKFASEIQKNFTASRRVDRGVRQAGFLVLRQSSMPSVLIEVGFISNREEERYMMSDKGQTELAQGIARAFTEYKHSFDVRQGISPSVKSDIQPVETRGKESTVTNKSSQRRLPPPGSEEDILMRKKARQK